MRSIAGRRYGAQRRAKGGGERSEWGDAVPRTEGAGQGVSEERGGQHSPRPHGGWGGTPQALCLSALQRGRPRDGGPLASYGLRGPAPGRVPRAQRGQDACMAELAEG